MSILNLIGDNVFSVISIVILIQSIISIYRKRKKQIKLLEMWRLPGLLSLVAVLGYVQIHDFSVHSAFTHLWVWVIGLLIGYLRIHWSKLTFSVHLESGAVYFHNNRFGVISLALLIVIKILLRTYLPPTTGILAIVISNYLVTFSCGTMIGRRLYLLQKYRALNS